MRFFSPFFCLLVLLWPALAAAKPLRLSTDNFVLNGDIGEAKAKSLLIDLELFRDSLFHFMGAEPEHEPIPVKIYVVRKEKELKEISGVSGFGGLYTQTYNGPSLLINMRAGFGQAQQARHIALHEYSHHFMTTYGGAHYPRWYSEGLADYLATFTYKDGVYKMGESYEPASLALTAFDWLPIDTLLESVKDYPFDGGDSNLNRSLLGQKYYAQAWVMVHYIQSHKDYRAGLKDYIFRVNNGQDSLSAFEKAFKIGPKDFQEKIRAYHAKGDYKSRIFSRPPLPLPDIATVKLARAELELAKLSAQRDFSLGGPWASETIEAIKVYEQKYKPSPASLMLKADLAKISHDDPEVFSQALTNIYSSLAQEPDNLEAKLIAARLTVNGDSLKLDISPEQRGLARQYISDFLEAHPNHKYGWSLQRIISARAP